MALIIKRFRTKVEAEAFLEGVDYVNDSSISLLGVKYEPHKEGNYAAQLEDQDRVFDSEELCEEQAQ